jgi:hypothetical protein
MVQKAPKGASGQWITAVNIPVQYAQAHVSKKTTTFFHPDCTVGSGIPPDHAK